MQAPVLDGLAGNPQPSRSLGLLGVGPFGRGEKAALHLPERLLQTGFVLQNPPFSLQQRLDAFLSGNAGFQIFQL